MWSNPLPRRLPLFYPGSALLCVPWAEGGGVRRGDLALGGREGFGVLFNATKGVMLVQYH